MKFKRGDVVALNGFLCVVIAADGCSYEILNEGGYRVSNVNLDHFIFVREMDEGAIDLLLPLAKKAHERLELLNEARNDLRKAMRGMG